MLLLPPLLLLPELVLLLLLLLLLQQTDRKCTLFFCKATIGLLLGFSLTEMET